VYGTGLIALDVVNSADESQPVRAWAGGTCGNVLTILSFLGWRSYPIARLNGDNASVQVKSDFLQWGVNLDFAECAPSSATPIIVQKIRRDKNGLPIHRFALNCPHCGNWLPGFKPVTASNMSWIIPKFRDPKVFFMDRLSRAALSLAAYATEQGAIIVFEPSAKMDPRLLKEVLQLAHVIKYADQRISDIEGVDCENSSILLEIQTVGADGMRYRSSLPKARSNGWVHLPAFPAPVLADTCGAGDWCTAGLISIIGTDGLKGFLQLNTIKLRSALKFGQALAAWTCGFEGARGGMYYVDKKTFDKQIQYILKGETAKASERPKQQTSSSIQSPIVCPACKGID
jgi:fructokinase